MADSQATLYRIENNRRFSSDSDLRTETCFVCKHVMEERWADLWYVISPNGDDQRMIDEPIQGPGQRLVCSQRCNSQLVYDAAPETVRDLMRFTALKIHGWFENVNLKSLDWCLLHSFITHVIPHATFEVMNHEMNELAENLLGRDWRDMDYPAWFEDAISPVAPAKPVGQVVAI